MNQRARCRNNTGVVVAVAASDCLFCLVAFLVDTNGSSAKISAIASLTSRDLEPRPSVHLRGESIKLFKPL